MTQTRRGLRIWIIAATALLSLGAHEHNEVNNTCICAGTCPGTPDSPGYPLDINGSGNFVLMENLSPNDCQPAPAAVALPGVVIIANGVTLDLGGFRISGGFVGNNFLDGVDGVHVGPHFSVVVRDGTVQGMQDDGVDAQEAYGVQIEGIRALSNAEHGIVGGASAIISKCTVTSNGEGGRGDGIVAPGQNVIVSGCAAGNSGRVGINLGRDSVVSNSTALESDLQGFVLGPRSRFLNNTSANNANPDTCGDGLCTERKRFYLTLASFNGADADIACAEGFHLASVWEIFDPSPLAYDYRRPAAFKLAPGSGLGAPASAGGWAWTGENGVTFDCRGWSSASAADIGTSFSLNGAVRNDRGVKRISPWEGTSVGCSLPQRVWCVEDPPL